MTVTSTQAGADHDRATWPRKDNPRWSIACQAVRVCHRRRPDRDSIDYWRLIDTVTGTVQDTVPTGPTGQGYRRLLSWASGVAPSRRVWALEGTGSFAAALASVLAEAVRTSWRSPVQSASAKPEQRIDAARAARAACWLATTRPSRGHAVDRKRCGRFSLPGKRFWSAARKRSTSSSLIVVAPEHPRARLRGVSLPTQLAAHCRADLPDAGDRRAPGDGANAESIAARIQFLIDQAAELLPELAKLVGPSCRARQC